MIVVVDRIERFEELISIRNGYIDIQEVQVSYQEEILVKLFGFQIHRGDLVEEFGSRMDQAVEYLKGIRRAVEKRLRIEEERGEYFVERKG